MWKEPDGGWVRYDDYAALSARVETLEEVAKWLTDPVKLRELIMMSGAHLSQQQAMDIIEDDRSGAIEALKGAQP